MGARGRSGDEATLFIAQFEFFFLKNIFKLEKK